MADSWSEYVRGPFGRVEYLAEQHPELMAASEDELYEILSEAHGAELPWDAVWVLLARIDAERQRLRDAITYLRPLRPHLETGSLDRVPGASDAIRGALAVLDAEEEA